VVKRWHSELSKYPPRANVVSWVIVIGALDFLSEITMFPQLVSKVNVLGYFDKDFVAGAITFAVWPVAFVEAHLIAEVF
jgi:hypothetical protein